MLRSYDVIEGDPSEMVHGYRRQCAIEVTTEDLAVMAATIADGGLQPGEQIVWAACARQVVSVMTMGLTRVHLGLGARADALTAARATRHRCR